YSLLFLFHPPAPTATSTLSLHDALPISRDDVLTFEEIVRVTRILVDQCGVRTIRLTGGEPLVRKGIEDLTAMIAGIDGELDIARSEEHTSELQSLAYLVCRLLLEKKKKK